MSLLFPIWQKALTRTMPYTDHRVLSWQFAAPTAHHDSRVKKGVLCPFSLPSQGIPCAAGIA